MRLDSLHLEFFGHFTDKKFEFGEKRATHADFHVIYGPNEAGKTTFMEGYLRLLYGFLAREPYDFVHQRKNLRISGNLRIDGASKAFIRRPARNASLTDSNDTPLPESALQAHLGGLAMQDYRNLLCIDDETIEKGGEEIVNSKGDIGTLLFSAAAGISDLSTLLDTVREQADLLYKKNTKSTELAKLKSQLKELEARIAEQDLTATQYKKLKSQLKAADIEKDKVKVERDALYHEHDAVQKQLDALPLLQEIAELDVRLAPLSHYPEKLSIEHKQLVDMLPLEAKAMSQISLRSKDIEAYTAELKQIDLDDKQLSIAESLEQLQPLHAAFTTARLSLEGERVKLAEAEKNMAFAAREFTDADIDPVQLLIPASLINDLDKSIQSKNKAAQELESASTSLQKIQDSVAEKKVAMAALTPEDDNGQAVSQILEEFNGQIFLNEALDAQKRGDEAEQDVLKALDELAIKGQNFTSVPVCRLHSDEAEKLVKDFESAEKDIIAVATDKQDAAVHIQTLQTQISKLQAIDGMSDDEQIAMLKQQRNAAWQAHREDYLPESADTFEATLFQHDQGMEGRMANASKLGELRQLSKQLVDAQANVEKYQRREASLVAQTQAIQRELADCVKSAGLTEAISPSLAKSWIADCENAAAAERTLERIKAELAPVFDKALRLHVALSKHIVRDQATLKELMEAAREIDSEYRLRRKNIDENQAELNRLEADQARQLERVAELTPLLEQENSKWNEQVAQAFSVEIDPNRLEPVLNTLRTLRELNRDRDAALQQVATMEAAIKQFNTEVDALSKRMNVPRAEDTLQTYDALKALATETLAARNRQNELRKLIASSEESLAQANIELESIRVQKDQFAEFFDSSIATSSINDLIAAEKTAREYIQARERRAEALTQLLSGLEVVTLDDAKAQLDELDAAQLQVRLRETSTDISEVNARYDEAMEQLGSCKRALSAIVGDASIAELEQQRVTVELEMTDVALEYLKLSLGHKLAQKAIMQYREKHRSSMMLTTESVFRELTKGAYSRLQTNTNGSVETLQVVQANGTAKSVHEPSKSKRTDTSNQSDLSKGTRFQLYLALRAAAYEQLAARGTCLPFICDDIFETFDERRTHAACGVLQRIGNTGQAIYLTHHQHVVDIAREVCGEQVTIHSL